MTKNVGRWDLLTNDLTFLTLLITFVLFLSSGWSHAQVTQQKPQGELTPCGHFSSIFLRAQDISYAEDSPTHLPLMTSRWATLRISAAGYQRTGVRLVGWDGSRLVATESKDDSGLDYFIPQLSSLFRLGLAEGVDVFIGGLIVFCCSLGLLGLLFVLQGRWLKMWAVVEVLLLVLLCLRVGDVYVVQSLIVILIIPWVLYFSRKWQSGLQFPFFLAVGIALGIANFVRAQAGITVLLFCIPVIVFYGRTGGKRRALLLASLLAATGATTLYFRHVFVVRDAYIQSHQPDYSPASRQHPLWHSIYIGLGFISNPYVPGGYCDQVGLNGVHAVSPATSFFSPDYDRILGQQVYSLAKGHPYVLLVNLAAKLGILQFTVLLAGNIGLLAALRYRRPLALETAFWLAAGFGLLPGLLAVPVPKYVVGGITVMVLYGLVSLDQAFRQSTVRDGRHLPVVTTAFPE